MTIVIHGGAGRKVGDERREKRLREALAAILALLWQDFQSGRSAREIARRGVMLLEDCELFNAGYGSAIQSDGSVRMSASLMDGERQAFSGVINVEGVQNPIVLADALQAERDRVIDGRGAELLARELKLPLFDPIVERRLEEWMQQRRAARQLDQAAVSTASIGGEEPGSGTVGVVVRDGQGRLAAATSTGGRGFERPGRVSDSATVAGNYATCAGAVSCTGIGEDIADEALAARIVVRLDDGWSLEAAIDSAMAGALKRERRLAAIAVDRAGNMSWGRTTEVLLAVGRQGEQVRWGF